jgi:anaerobic dimethyl sulfoxide reductase subunit C (anchor subunit)
MSVREWALVAFTILAQTAVGSFLVLQVVHFLAARKAGQDQADEMSSRALLAIWPVLGLGLLASLLHLGSPLNAYRAATNIGTSWLSREILCGVLFAVAGFGYALMQWRKVGSPALRGIIAWIAALVGVALVFSMSMVYMIPTRPSWNLFTTPVSFFVTTLLLGVLAMGAAYVANYAYVHRSNPSCAKTQCELLHETLRWIAVSAIVLLGCQFVVLPLSLALMTAGGAAATVEMMVVDFGLLFVLRLALVFLGAGILGVFVYKEAQNTGRDSLLSTYAYAAFALVFVGEVLGRLLYYVTATTLPLQ